MTFEGLPLSIFPRIISKSIDLILRFECIQNGRLSFPKIANCAKLSKKGGGPRVETNFIAKDSISGWGSAPMTPNEI